MFEEQQTPSSLASEQMCRLMSATGNGLYLLADGRVVKTVLSLLGAVRSTGKQKDLGLLSLLSEPKISP